MDSRQTLKYADLQQFSQIELEQLDEDSMEMIANCDDKKKFEQMAESNLIYLHATVDPSSPDVGDHIGYRLEVTLKDQTELFSVEHFANPNPDVLERVQTQFRLATDILEQID